ncbi:FAD-dependent oxidoreductase [Prauserella cavernicola]|uniref:FAD-dependent oxidoreductase n=1 Tax=Prauserella cavernicola TaxID=2800127 RepID=A0A934QZB0_9PSEU|nr:FAD-dependent oxidoreductase [Prauserella cavernicola]MBK1789171.1 FAD-dependent oxidoreductase [Prauserella cavernicola]
MTNVEDHYDCLVAGSGAAGLMAAITAASAGLRVLVAESGAELGGTTALSGGRVWIPGYRSAADTVEAGIRYLAQVYDPAHPEFVEALAHTAPEMAEFVERTTPHRWRVCPNYPDYLQHLDGATAGGRCFDMEPITLGNLVPQAGQIRVAPGYRPITHAEWERWRRPDRFDHALLERRMAAGIRTGGPALAAALIDGAVRAGVRIVASCEVTGLREDKEDLVVTLGGARQVRAGAVVLATGGYDRDDAHRGRMPSALAVSASAPGCTGASLELAERLGAAIDDTGEGWWMPMTQVPGESVDGAAYPRSLVRERGVPRQIVVDADGRRFLNEALPYNEIGKALHAHGGTAHLVVDEGFRRRYPLPGLPADGPVPPHVAQGADLRELALAAGIDPDGLTETVARWNGVCAEGQDHDHGRGESIYDRYYGDPDLAHAPNLGPLDRPPFYAIRLLPGTIGSKGGPRTSVDGEVLRPDGTSIPGLYAAGNAAAAWTGDGYPGPGATLAVGMTFGYRAGRAIARRAGSSTLDAVVKSGSPSW